MKLFLISNKVKIEILFLMMKHKLCTSKQINLILDKNLSVRLFLVVKYIKTTLIDQ